MPIWLRHLFANNPLSLQTFSLGKNLQISLLGSYSKVNGKSKAKSNGGIRARYSKDGRQENCQGTSINLNQDTALGVSEARGARVSEIHSVGVDTENTVYPRHGCREAYRISKPRDSREHEREFASRHI